MDEWIESTPGATTRRIDGGIGPERLRSHLAEPPGGARRSALVLCHGMPAGDGAAAGWAATYPDLAQRIARHTGWTVLTFNFRGTGESEGDFSLAGWVDDVHAAVDALTVRTGLGRVHVVGSSLGGSVGLVASAADDRVAGVATLGSPANPRGARDPDGLLADSRRIGMVRRRDFPADRGAWADDVKHFDPVAAARALHGRALLVLHGSDDDLVPVDDARALAEASGDRSALRIVYEARHQLRHDPRAIAVLLGWLERR